MKEDIIIEAIERSRGNITVASQTLGITRQTFYNRIKGNYRIRKAIEAAKESMLDVAENILYDKVLAGEPAALFFFLKTQGWRRGYIEHHDITGKMDSSHTERQIIVVRKELIDGKGEEGSNGRSKVTVRDHGVRGDTHES